MQRIRDLLHRNQAEHDAERPVQYTVWVKTGDMTNAGTNDRVSIRLHSADGKATDTYRLFSGCNWLNVFSNEFARGSREEFTMKVALLDDIDHIELWRENASPDDDWFMDTMEILSNSTERTYTFPFHRWMKGDNHYKIRHLDTSLPSDDPFNDQRVKELEERRTQYEIHAQQEGLPGQVKNLPEEENFSHDYSADLNKRKIKLLLTSEVEQFVTGTWTHLDDLKNVYTKETLVIPQSADNWQDDGYFGRQRLVKVNHSVIQLCTAVPSNLAVTDDMVGPVIEGLTLQQAIQDKRLFYIDYKVLEGVPGTENRKICAPIALFFVDKDKQLMPVAIQLHQIPADHNPVFLPTDHKYTWLTAKLWFNNADCSYHQSFTHLGATHLMMEGVVVVLNRNLSRSHPVYKLLAPHCLFLLAINSRALGKLVSPGGWVDKSMSIGRLGMFEIVRRLRKTWRMDVQGTLPKELESRGVLDENVLPGYHYREDALPIYHIIEDYVTKYVALYYGYTMTGATCGAGDAHSSGTPDLAFGFCEDSPEKLEGDKEIQTFAVDLVKPTENGGCGIQGVPGNGQFTTNDQLTACLTSVIFTCSVAHAATNFAQYDQYGFPPAYPASMTGTPPTNKSRLGEDCVMAALPDKATTLDTMVITKILSEKATKSLGDFETQYIFDPKALEVVEEFKYKLKQLSLSIKQKNVHRIPPYPWLDPEEIPNAISI